MLDKKTATVLHFLIREVGENYKVVNKSQLLSAMPGRLHLSIQDLSKIITFLKENEYLDVKYQDKDEICLAVTVKAVSYSENAKNVEQKASISTTQIWLLVAGTFLAAFLGALIATWIGKLF